MRWLAADFQQQSNRACACCCFVPTTTPPPLSIDVHGQELATQHAKHSAALAAARSPGAAPEVRGRGASRGRAPPPPAKASAWARAPPPPSEDERAQVAAAASALRKVEGDMAALRHAAAAAGGQRQALGQRLQAVHNEARGLLAQVGREGR
jgi:hypothetical protein